MLLPHFTVVIFAAGLIVSAGAVSGQEYPNKPVRMIAAEPGGGADVMARLIGQGLSGSLGQQVVIENRGGASGAIAAEFVARSPADGYTILFYANVVWLLPFMRKNVPFDPVKDFAPISLAASSPNVLVVHPALPVKSVPALIALAKARPGELAYSTGGSGTTLHLSGELFKAIAGVNILHVPYKSGGGALNGLVGGEVQVSFLVAAAAIPQIKAGKLRAMAVTSAQPSELLPGLPTIAASGLPGYSADFTSGIFAPAATPAALINRLNQEIVALLNKADVKERFFNLGVKAIGSSPERLAATVKADMAKWSKVIRETGIRAD
ncbi:MAG: tripartite tricarboxylate transporter substrate binding protein [Betaproteobacteria bacterium]|nr:tripartite tricarboxylate transporter substrate binding protein [Betaproteobacteria bacterium]